MRKIALSLIALGLALTAACGSDSSDDALPADQAQSSTTVTTIAAAVAEVVAAPPPAPSSPTTVQAKPKAVPVTTKPTNAPTATTTPTTAATAPVTVPVTATTAPPVETTTTTTVATVTPTCTASVTNPDAAKGSPQSVHLVSNMPDTKTRLTIQYPKFGTGKPNPRQEFRPVTDAAGSWTVDFTTIDSSTVPATVRVEFYNVAGQIMAETCSTTFNATP